ncbi:hypothetical protein AKJ16_DCAP04735 [Drosera capensis]
MSLEQFSSSYSPMYSRSALDAWMVTKASCFAWVWSTNFYNFEDSIRHPLNAVWCFEVPVLRRSICGNNMEGRKVPVRHKMPSNLETCKPSCRRGYVFSYVSVLSAVIAMVVQRSWWRIIVEFGCLC